MVAMSNVMEQNATPNLAISGRPLSRIFTGFCGFVLTITAAGMWLVPGSNWDSALMLIKLGLTSFLLLGGIMLMQSARRTLVPEVHLDPRGSRLILIERDDRGQVQREIKLSYDDLSEIDFRDNMLIARDHHGQTIVQMPLDNVDNLDEIRAALGPAFSRAA